MKRRAAAGGEQDERLQVIAPPPAVTARPQIGQRGSCSAGIIPARRMASRAVLLRAVQAGVQCF